MINKKFSIKTEPKILIRINRALDSSRNKGRGIQGQIVAKALLKIGLRCIQNLV